MATIYVMRALNTVTSKYISWTSIGVADLTGEFSGVDPSDLSGIAVDYTTTQDLVPTANETTILLDGDLDGTLADPVVVGLQGNPIDSAAPSDGEILTFDDGYWKPLPGGGSGSGIRVVADLTERDAIPGDERSNAMLVYVLDNGDGPAYYQLDSGLTNLDWSIANFVHFTQNLVSATLTTGSVASTSLDSSLLTIDGKIVANGIDTSLLSSSDQGIIYYDLSENKFKVSEDGGAYTNLLNEVSVADDIEQSGGPGTEIDRVVGISGVPIDTDSPNIGTSLVYNTVDGTSIKRKKPASVGNFDPHDYGALGDGVTDDSAAFATMFNDINAGLSINYQSATVSLREKTRYYFNSTLIIDQSIRLVGQGGGSYATDGNTQFKFAPGCGIWFRARGIDVPRGSGSVLKDIECIFQLLPGILPYEHNTSYLVGDIVQFGHDRELLFEVVTAGTTETATNAAGVGVTEWAALTAYSQGDVVVPTSAKQNGHKYICITAGNSGASEPDVALFGGWDWRSASLITDGTVVWQEDGIYQAHHDYLTPRPFTDATSSEVCWTAGKTYHHNAVVRIVGHGSEWTKWLWNANGTAGVSGGSSPSLAGALGSTVVDGTITWTIIDPAAHGLIFVDGTVRFFPRAHPGIAIRAPGVRLEGCRLSGSTNDAIQIIGVETAPTSNVNFWRITNCSFSSTGLGASGGQGGGGCINVRGGDANGGCVVGSATGGAFPITQVLGVEAMHGGRDYSLAGSSWHGCAWSEGLFGYAFDFGETTSCSIHGSYSEGGPSRLPAGTFVGCIEGSAQTSWTRDSKPVAPRFGRGIFGLARHSSGSHDVTAQLAGRYSPTSLGFGQNAFAIQAIGAGDTGEENETAIAWKIANWDTGWWGLAFGPSIYGGAFATFAFTGDRAGASRGISSAGQFTVVRKILGFGPPDTGTGAPFAIAFNNGIPTSGAWKKGDIVFYENPSAGGKVGAVCVASGTPGTWHEFGNINSVELSSQTLTGLFLAGNYTSGTWEGSASAGTSGSNDATEVTNPPSVGSTLNGYATVEGNGVDDELTLGAGNLYYSSSTSFGGAIVFRAKTAGAVDNTNPYFEEQIFASATNAIFGVSFSTSGVKVWMINPSFGYSGAQITFPCAVEEWHKIEWSYDGTDLKARFDDGDEQSVAVGSGGISAFAWSTQTLKLFNGVTGGFFDGRLAAVILDDAAPSLSTRDSWRTALGQKFLIHI